ncbi:ATP-dependent RecD-like DNA helicase [Fictibacillus nanhaiensis]|uniref:SF1B family DNA helicase RecD2 n=1 Tax=Fictibacillus nanhaiensis TaxID=742169 RepID=UPI001C94D3FF|nr:ATP-dependent RecD-like DNA helicase [Fictibacillus nanhaiensis]MBY6035363.1 ATP-dependent RecD-like DNA helicase [Fictibacillus nanhaiensis]
MAQQPSFNLQDETNGYIKGTLIVTVYHQSESLYTVARVRVKETNEDYNEKEAMITGILPPLREDEQYLFYGKFKDHPKYGKQYEVEFFKKEMPQSREAMIQYLSSDLFKGIGKKTAEHIVEVMGDDAIQKLLETPDYISQIPKLTEEQAKNLYDSLLQNRGLDQVMMVVQPYGIGPQLAMKIFQTYKDDSVSVIKNEPYRLIEDVPGIGFHRADEIAKGNGMQVNHPERIQAACHFILRDQGTELGHSYLPVEDLLEGVRKLLADGKNTVDEMSIFREIHDMETEKRIILKENVVYLPSLYYAERGFAQKINQLLQSQESDYEIPHEKIETELTNLEERLKINYAKTQKEAIKKALTSSLMVLTGGPGTGKTTVIKGIVELYSEIHGISLNPDDYRGKKEPFPVLLVAPTGRAAKRMTESTGIPAHTIHRLLGWRGAGHFEKNEEEPIEGKLLIVDEMSMVDIWLAYSLSKALPKHIQVIFVGDEDQLPSVGPGQVLKDLLSSTHIPQSRLTDIYRQAEGSSIIRLAHDMKKGNVPKDLLTPQKDRRFFPCSGEQVFQVIMQVCENAIKKGYSSRDIQVLAPMYKGPIGIDRLNMELQRLFNPEKEKQRQLQVAQSFYRKGDKVLQLVNQPEDNVFNGDIGEIVAVIYAKENTDKEDQIVISFDEIEVTYKRSEFHHFTHAFCCSIHKSQGSEYPIVILPVVKSYYRMLKRNLIYTAITRSKEYLILCGEQEAFSWAVQRSDESERYSGLKVRLEETLLEKDMMNDTLFKETN